MNELLRMLREKGFFYIFGASTINKIIQFCSGIFLVRFISKNDFGVYSQAQNIINIFVLFIGLGTNYALMQFGSESKDFNERKSFFKLGLKVSIPFNFFISFLIGVYTLSMNISDGKLKVVLISMIFLPMFIYFFEFFQIYFRTSLYNVEFSRLSMINTILMFCLSILGAISIGIFGIVFGNYVAYFISIFIGAYWLYNKGRMEDSTIKIKNKTKKDFFNYSIISMLSNSISSFVYLIDIFLIGFLISDSQVLASYKTATLIPFALNFIPISIMTFVYPYFAKNRDNKKWILKMYKKLQFGLFVLNFFIMLVLVIFAPLIINLLFGTIYMDSIPYFRILSIGYFVASAFRIPAGNVLSMIKKIKFLFITNCIVGVINIVLDFYLIKNYSAIGASISTLVIITLTSLIYNIYIYTYLRRK